MRERAGGAAQAGVGGARAQGSFRQDDIRRETMTAGVEPIVFYLTIFVLAVFVGYHVIWNVTPALHTPLMSLTNAISSIILVGAMLAAGAETLDWGGWLGVLAVALVSINTFGGFLVTQRMLEMFKKKEPKAAAKKE
jgi:NAD(P) transhydrogenase subunit alpha